MKYSILLVVLALAGMAKADPIQDHVVNGYKAAWMPSSATPCPKVCEAADGAKAEAEKFTAMTFGNKISYVCKSEIVTTGAYAGKGTLYGNNFDSTSRNKLCMVSTADGTVKRVDKFYCLCVY